MSRSTPKYSFLKRVLPDAGWLSIAPLANQSLKILLLPVMTYYLSPEEHGILSITTLIAGLVSLLADWGFGVGLTCNYFDHTGDTLKEFLFTIMATVIFTSGLLYGAAFFFAPLLGELLAPNWRPEFAVYLHLQVIAVGLTTVQIVAQNYLLVAQRPQKLAILKTSANVVSVVLQLILLAVFGLGLYAVYCARVVAGLATLLLSIGLIWHDMKPSFRPHVIRDVWQVGWATWPSAIMAHLVRFGDHWVLQAFLPLSDLGLYNFGSRFEAIYLQMYNQSIRSAWKANDLHMLKENVSDAVLRNHANYLLELSLVVMTGIALFSKEVILILAEDRFHSSYVVVPLLVFGALFRTVNIIPTNRLIHEKKVPYSLLTLIPSAVVAFGLAWVLLPRFGMIGVAISNVWACLLTLVIQTIWVLRVTECGMQISVRRWTLLVAMAILVLAAGVLQPAYLSLVWLGLKMGLFVVVISTVGWLERERLQPVLRVTYQRFSRR